MVIAGYILGSVRNRDPLACDPLHEASGHAQGHGSGTCEHGLAREASLLRAGPKSGLSAIPLLTRGTGLTPPLSLLDTIVLKEFTPLSDPLATTSAAP